MTGQGPGWRRESRFQTPATGLDEIHDFVRSFWLRNDDVGERDRMRFETAVIELFGVIIGRSGSGGRLSFTLTIRRSAASLTGTVCHDGAEISIGSGAPVPNPWDLAESGGGTSLIKLLVDELSFERDEGCNCWRLTLNLSRTRDRGHD